MLSEPDMLKQHYYFEYRDEQGLVGSVEFFDVMGVEIMSNSDMVVEGTGGKDDSRYGGDIAYVRDSVYSPGGNEDIDEVENMALFELAIVCTGRGRNTRPCHNLTGS